MLVVIILAMLIVLTVGMTLTAFAFGEVAFSDAGSVNHLGIRASNRRSATPQCPSCSNHPIRVSTPETLAIVELVRTTQSADEVERIHELSRSNARRIQGLTLEQYAQERIVCPLLSREGDCVAYDTRPLHCRGCGLSAEHAGAQCWQHQTEMEYGVSQGLRAAGLDGNLYELNEALSVAMERRDIATRWAQGENVLAG